MCLLAVPGLRNGRSSSSSGAAAGAAKVGGTDVRRISPSDLWPSKKSRISVFGCHRSPSPASIMTTAAPGQAATGEASSAAGSSRWTAPAWAQDLYGRFPLVNLEQEDELEWKKAARTAPDVACSLWVGRLPGPA